MYLSICNIQHWAPILGGEISNIQIESILLEYDIFNKIERVLWENKGERNYLD